MKQNLPDMMRAAVLDRFGGADMLVVRTIPTPKAGPEEVLIRVEYAGVGEWDPFEREGGYAQMLGIVPAFPYVLGSEGSGEIAAVGEQVDRFKAGDQVYAPAFLNPKGGFYAEYAAVNAGQVASIPSRLSMEQAGVMSGVGITGLRGLEDTLRLQPGEAVMIFGASGGIGHLAVQLARQIGARVLAVASGEDGVSLVKQLGAELVIDGHQDDVLAAARTFASQGLDAMLLTAGGAVAERAIEGVRSGGRIAYPNGVQITPPEHRMELEITGYYGDPDPEIIRRFSARMEKGAFHVHVAETYPLERAAQAHRALEDHYLGKLALKIR